MCVWGGRFAQVCVSVCEIESEAEPVCVSDCMNFKDVCMCVYRRYTQYKNMHANTGTCAHTHTFVIL